jgi:hypothetical protein
MSLVKAFDNAWVQTVNKTAEATVNNVGSFAKIEITWMSIVVIVTLAIALVVMGFDWIGPDLVFGALASLYMVMGAFNGRAMGCWWCGAAPLGARAPGQEEGDTASERDQEPDCSRTHASPTRLCTCAWHASRRRPTAPRRSPLGSRPDDGFRDFGSEGGRCRVFEYGE